MKSIRSFKTGLALVGLLLALGGANVARAVAFTVNLDTSAIVNHSSGPFYLDFQSIFGSGADQTITLSNFSLTGGGFVAGSESAIGDVTGSLGSSLVLSASSGSVWNEFWQQFESTVTGIKFTADLTTNATTDTPTSFSVSILDNVFLYAIPTTGFADTLLNFNIDGGSVSYSSGVRTGDTAGVSAHVPETGGTVGLVAGAMLVLGLGRRLRRNLSPVAA